MTKREAYALGVASGIDAGTWGDFAPEELADEDSFLSAVAEICENKRQYAGHPGERFDHRESLWDAFEEGEAVGARKAWRIKCKQGR